jgi:hypothetical protein
MHMEAPIHTLQNATTDKLESRMMKLLWHIADMWDEKCIKNCIWWDHMGELGIGGKVILKWILKKQGRYNVSSRQDPNGVLLWAQQ